MLLPVSPRLVIVMAEPPAFTTRLPLMASLSAALVPIASRFIWEVLLPLPPRVRSLLKVKVPVAAPLTREIVPCVDGEPAVPPATVTAPPTVPLPPRVPPALTPTGPAPMEPVTFSVPAVTVVGPV